MRTAMQQLGYSKAYVNASKGPADVLALYTRTIAGRAAVASAPSAPAAAASTPAVADLATEDESDEEEEVLHPTAPSAQHT